MGAWPRPGLIWRTTSGVRAGRRSNNRRKFDYEFGCSLFRVDTETEEQDRAGGDGWRGGYRGEGTRYLTPLEAAKTPNLDALCKDSAQGRMIPVAPGITPGSGPGHLGLFGYDPVEFQVGRGVIEALGLGMELKAGDVARARQFCTLDAKGIVTDRRAGRIPTPVCEELCALLSKKIKKIEDAEVLIQRARSTGLWWCSGARGSKAR